MNKTFKTVLVLVILILFIRGLSASDKVIVSFDIKELHIPSEYLSQNYFVGFFRKVFGVDSDDSSFIVKIKSDEVSNNIKNYVVSQPNKFKDDLELLIIELNGEELNNYNSPLKYRYLDELWLSIGGYKERITEPVDDSNWFKVYRKVEYPNSFSVISQLPINAEPLPNMVSDFWVAHCLQFGSGERKTIRCESHLYIDNLIVEFNISYENLRNIESIKQFIYQKVNSWIVDD